MSDDNEPWRKLITKPQLTIVKERPQVSPPTLPAKRRPRLVVLAIGAGLGLTSLAMNLTYAIGQGASLADQISWASGASLVEALSLVFPSLALEFWRSRQRLASLACAGIAL